MSEWLYITLRHICKIIYAILLRFLSINILFCCSTVISNMCTFVSLSAYFIKRHSFLNWWLGKLHLLWDFKYHRVITCQDDLKNVTPSGWHYSPRPISVKSSYVLIMYVVIKLVFFNHKSNLKKTRYSKFHYKLYIRTIFLVL